MKSVSSNYTLYHFGGFHYVVRLCRQVRIMPIKDKFKENRLRWFDHIRCKSKDALVRRIEKIDIAQGKKLRGRQKMTWMEVIKNYMKLLQLEERMVVDRND